MQTIELDNCSIGWYATVYQVRNKFRSNPSVEEVSAGVDIDDDQINDLILEAQAIVDAALVQIYPNTFPLPFVIADETAPTIPPLSAAPLLMV